MQSRRPTKNLILQVNYTVGEPRKADTIQVGAQGQDTVDVDGVLDAQQPGVVVIPWTAHSVSYAPSGTHFRGTDTHN